MNSDVQILALVWAFPDNCRRSSRNSKHRHLYNEWSAGQGQEKGDSRGETAEGVWPEDVRRWSGS